MEKGFVFDKLIMDAEEFSALASNKTDFFYVGALTVVALCNYRSGPDICYAMLDKLKNPAEPVSVYEKQFLRDRLGGKDYKPFSFFDGTNPQNGYTPSEPYKISLRTIQEVLPGDDRATVWLHSSGADSDRQISLRKKPSTGEWFMVEQFLLSDIRIPVSEDPWA